MIPLRDSNLVAVPIVHKIFPNIEQLLVAHTVLLSKLTDLAANWDTKGSGQLSLVEDGTCK
jgi:hypothetical protein